MAFYVPLGPRGLIFRLATAYVGLTGGLSYWWAYRKRPHLVTIRVEPAPLVDR